MARGGIATAFIFHPGHIKFPESYSVLMITATVALILYASSTTFLAAFIVFTRLCGCNRKMIFRGAPPHDVKLTTPL